MKAVILAGGKGKRLLPLTDAIPKPLLPLMNRPIITYILDTLPSEVKTAVISVNNEDLPIFKDYFKNKEYPFEIKFKGELTKLGTGGGIKNCEEFVSGEPAFLAFNGDVISSIDLSEFIKYFHKTGGLGAIAAWPVSEPGRYGIIQIDEENKIADFSEQEKMHEGYTGNKQKESPIMPTTTDNKYLINAGVYIFKPEILDFIEPGKDISIERKVYPKVLHLGLYSFRFSGYWIDAGTSAAYLDAQQMIFDNEILLTTEQLKNLTDKLKMDFPNVQFDPPVYVGKNIVIGDSCTIGPNVCFGDNVKLGNKCKIENSTIMTDTIIGNNTTLKNVIIGRSNQIGNNCKIWNFEKTADSSSFPDGSNVKGDPHK
jgi:mannose-1-phosphate guanylyltransferase